MLGLKNKIKSLIESSSMDGHVEGFDELALEIFYFQKEHNPILKKFWASLKPQSPWEIPPVPSETLRFVKLYHGKSEPHYFESSTTSSTKPLRHFFSDFDLYEQQVKKYFGQVFPDVKVHSLLEKREHWSLFQMIDFVKNLKGSRTLLVGTSKNLVQSLESHPVRPDLIFDTGGFKNFISPYTQEEFYEKLCEVYQILPHQIIGEYGMTELFSQAYDVTFEMKFEKRIKRTVPTMRVGEWQGRLRMIDLCNLDSCAFIVTGDEAELLNEREFRLLGRRDFQSLRGCSLR